VTTGGRPLLAGQSALITGAGAGIGRAIALAMAEAGARAIVNDLPDRLESAEATVAAIKARGGEATAIAGDVSREGDVVAMFRRAGDLHILVNNAGIETAAPFDELSLATWQAVIDVNLTGAFLCAREALRVFKRNGVDPAVSSAAGKILFISSVHQQVPRPNFAHYAAAKAGLMMLMRSLALEAGRFQVRVNNICPGATRTAMTAVVCDDPVAYEGLCGLIPLQRIGEPEDVARLAVWLASDQADYVHGASLFVDGGLSLQMNSRRLGGGLRQRLSSLVKRKLNIF
jgi:glucose 1-dehydrogenase